MSLNYNMDSLREKIDKIDEKILKLISQRQKIVKKVGDFKRKQKMPLKDSSREKLVLDNLEKKSKEYKISPLLIKKIWLLIFKDSYRIEKA